MRLRIDIRLYFELLSEFPLSPDIDLDKFNSWLRETWQAECARPSDNTTDPLLGWELEFDDLHKCMLFQIKYAQYSFTVLN